jgi:hypothetical protein
MVRTFTELAPEYLASDVFRFSFLTIDTNINLFFKTSAQFVGQEFICGIYKVNTTTNILDTTQYSPTNVVFDTGRLRWYRKSENDNIRSGIGPAFNNMQPYTNNSSIPDATISGLESNTVYHLITYTPDNEWSGSLFTSPEFAFSLESNNTQIPIIYREHAYSNTIIGYPRLESTFIQSITDNPVNILSGLMQSIQNSSAQGSTGNRSVEVNLNVVIDASGELSIFGAESAGISGEVVVAQYNLPTTCFYTGNVDGSGNVTDVSGLIELWEPYDNLGNIYCTLAQNIQGVSGDYYKDTAKKLAEELQIMFCSPFDASGATPFSSYKITDPSGYYWKPAHFGRLALSAHAYDMFGHVAATAAITNDVVFMQNMLDVSGGIQPASNIEDVNPAGRVSSYRKTDDRALGVLNTNWTTSSNSSANLALRMARAIVANGLNNITPVNYQNVTNANVRSNTLAAIVKQVVGQDASRLRTVDNNELVPDRRQALRFYTGDIVYMNVRIDKPNVIFNNNKATQLDDSIQTRNYAIKITLA